MEATTMAPRSALHELSCNSTVTTVAACDGTPSCRGQQPRFGAAVSPQHQGAKLRKRPRRDTLPAARNSPKALLQQQQQQKPLQQEHVLPGRLPEGVVDIDAAERDDAEWCSEYQAQHQAHLKAQEAQPALQITPESIARAQDPAVLKLQERVLLVNWMCGRAHGARLQAATLHSAVRLLDRALAALRLPDRLFGEALAAACLCAAVKLEEVDDLPARVAAAGLNAAVTPAAVAAAEASMCAALSFALTAPTAASFLPRYLKAAGVAAAAAPPHAAAYPYAPPPQRHQQQRHARVAQLAAYLAELALGCPDALRLRPSAVAAAAVGVALRTCGGAAAAAAAWLRTLAHESGYADGELAEVRALLARLHAGAEHSAMRCTYSRGAGAAGMFVALGVVSSS
ncbi:hypothetical protein JKP88DRAFT_295207 [Tribonema minus]|uniref:Cyclin N-terminal domain-containing protein n=1 Tax=Tribonema minus TaxID=303371 RepID=A0A835ZJ64_9STRA|nr:hypothetical protein JKP88DRAFT_295207 [Tribonema minus]